MRRKPIITGRGCSATSVKPAVTLVEVTATAVMLILAGLWLIPAAASVAGSSKNGKCLSNLMQIGYANAIYAAQDPGDMAIPVHHMQFNQCPKQSEGGLCVDPIYIGAYEWGGKSGAGRDDFVTGTPGDPLNSKYGTKAGFGPASRPLNRIIYPDQFDDHLNPKFDREGAKEDTGLELDIYQCPADTGYTGMHCPWFAEDGRTSYDHYGTSYNANVFMVVQDGACLDSPMCEGIFKPDEMGSNSPYLHRMSEVPNPARTLAYQENNGRFAWNAAPESPGCEFIGKGCHGVVRGWHGKDWTFNAAFIDGHADTIYMRGYDNECPPPAVGNDCESCIRVRGEGWQIDTRPAQYARTRLKHNRGGRPSWEDCLSCNEWKE